ncbi:Sigma-70 region 2 [Acetobacteraceae bacterium AT-5844]|nr:Sigma-70 region 2 [Acetobacteraceae bacterium AT-5844]
MPQEQDGLQLYLMHRQSLVDYATGLAGSRARAEDVVQEAWMRFRQALTQGWPERPEAYLYRIVRNLALDHARTQAAEERRDTHLSLVPPPATASPEDTLLHAEELRRIADALAELPERTRRAFELHRFSGMTFQEIATELGTSLPTAQRLTQTALLHIMRSLRKPA